MTDRYYEEEMRYLLEAGREYAKAHPEQARLLNLDVVSDRDPYVERLFEGFAFLSARVREKLDDEFPEFVKTLFSVMWPSFLRPVPPLAILEFRPRPGTLQAPRRIEPESAVLTAPIGKDRVRCKFRTCYPVELLPLRVSEVAAERTTRGYPAIRLTFELDKGLEWSKLGVSELRFYLHADAAAAFDLHLALTHGIQEVLALPDGRRLGGQELIQPSGFAADEHVFPQGRAANPAYGLLHEYFSVREKFLFVTISGFDRLDVAKDQTSFSLLLVLNKPLPESLRLSADNLRLYCAPVVNLFPHDPEPVRVDHTQFEYRVRASAQAPDAYEIYSVEGVRGVESGTGKQIPYGKFEDFNFQFDSSAVNQRTFTQRCGFSPSARWEAWVALHGIPLDANGPKPESLSVECLATNGKLPRDLSVNDISVATEDVPPTVPFGNLTRPTLPLYPPAKSLHLWKLLSHFAHNNLALDDVESLRELLRLYDWTGLEANARRIDGLQSLKVGRRDWFVDNALVRGVTITLDVVESHFAGRGDIHLFGQVLFEFCKRFVTMNSAVELTLTLIPTQETFRWTPSSGSQPLL